MVGIEPTTPGVAKMMYAFATALTYVLIIQCSFIVPAAKVHTLLRSLFA